MRGGAQSHMLTANDGHAYVVKFANNPQSLRVLANEWLGCSIGCALGLTIPEPAILYVPATLVESSPSLVIQVSNSTLKCSYGLAFGSRFISERLDPNHWRRTQFISEDAGKTWKLLFTDDLERDTKK